MASIEDVRLTAIGRCASPYHGRLEPLEQQPLLERPGAVPPAWTSLRSCSSSWGLPSRFQWSKGYLCAYMAFQVHRVRTYSECFRL